MIRYARSYAWSGVFLYGVHADGDEHGFAIYPRVRLRIDANQAAVMGGNVLLRADLRGEVNEELGFDISSILPSLMPQMGLGSRHHVAGCDSSQPGHHLARFGLCCAM